MQLLPNSKHIDLAILAESGQAFRIKKLSTSLYALPTANTVFVMEQTSEELRYEIFASGSPQGASKRYISQRDLVHRIKRDSSNKPRCTIIIFNKIPYSQGGVRDFIHIVNRLNYMQRSRST